VTLIEERVHGSMTVAGALVQWLVRLDRSLSPATGVGDRGLLDGLGQVRPQMPAVADLHCLRCCGPDRLGIGRRPVAAYDLHARMVTQPRGQGVGFAVGQHIDTAMGDRIDQQRRITAAPAQREVVHAQHGRRWEGGDRCRHQHPQHRATRNPGTDPGQHAGTGPARGDDGQVSDQVCQLRSPPRPPPGQRGYLLAKGPPWAGRHRTDKAPNAQVHDNSTTTDRQIGQTSLVIGVHSLAELPTVRAGHSRHRRPSHDAHRRPKIDDLLNDQRRQLREDGPDHIARPS
jgi:hypothetical protein